ncbi:uncharacterized protein LOC120007520 [Tripterygium wilfordii]|nr:uncharacterized protein LOC120007520 [Tripterygium wilfordii]XP_038713725.1 uncharacterized protein LOC120007520 [Tripterygium wilfordii]XP_038713734.1 uncharacterized protein LOC120007520 [Tripterygium wilfordii]XP_038713743.1 uncharacterized protein LOC120007520 [Tripterygium wilfordii]XP_038713752.1 uncharacterized protein LOC120007520 [Tripterygium wilfordii]XP_038713761.1 uncharacterized protein LOC120007520 [Tripterygium wilfordii]
MLRISEKDEKDVREFQTLHVEAKDKGFGRIFRSPSLFEDAVKSILLCNCTWKRSLEMAKALCELQQKVIDLKPIGKRARYLRNQAENVSGKKVKGQVTGDFPSAKELASLDEDFLKQHCKVGYRSKSIIQLAKEYKKGTSMLNEVEEVLDSTNSYKKIHRKLLKIKGFGRFASATVMMCIGCYEYVTIDSETIRLLHKIHAMENCTEATVKEDVKRIYEKYEPFQSLAYWFELLCDYEDEVGKLSELPHSSYHSVSGRLFHSGALKQELRSS